MNIEKYLILLRDKDGKFRDRSEDIETYKDYGKIIKVKFYNNENLTLIIIDKETDSIPSSPWGAGINTTIIWKRG